AAGPGAAARSGRARGPAGGSDPCSASRPAQLGKSRPHRRDDALIAGTAAKVGPQHIQQQIAADIGLALQHADEEHQKARGAEAALQPMMGHEGALQRMQGPAIREVLDGANGAALRLYGKHQAGADRLAVEQHRACAARTVLATHMRPGQAAFFPDRIEQGAARLQLQTIGPIVDGKRDIQQFTHARLLRSGAHAWVRARYTMAPATSRRYCALVCASY